MDTKDKSIGQQQRLSPMVALCYQLVTERIGTGRHGVVFR